jgi:hypothetical protein
MSVQGMCVSVKPDVNNGCFMCRPVCIYNPTSLGSFSFPEVQIFLLHWFRILSVFSLIMKDWFSQLYKVIGRF